ncbi:hypothetical protein PAMP_003982 [Pampus punctatissimus]
MTRSRVKSSGSFFQKLPAEVFHMVLDKLSVLEIGVFSMVSKQITSYVVDYINTLAWKNKMIIQSFHHSTCHEQRSTIEHYRDLGLLFKRCTLLLPTKDRLKFIFSMFSQVPCFMLEQCSALDCIGFSSYGAFLQTLIAGWDELECHRVFIFLCDLTNLLQKIESVITGKPGVRWYQELQVRLFCRQVLLDPWPNRLECQFWLVQLLKPWPMVSQAHLLFILYGPLPPEVIPQPWHVENVARLLVLCGNNLCYTVLASKALNGRVLEISRLIIFIILVCEKDGYHMSWAVKLVQQICKVFSTAPEKFCFIQHLESMFSEVTREFFEFSVAGK